MRKTIPEVWRESTGRLGEELIRHFLAKEGIIAISAGESRLPFDLIIPIPDGKIFEKKAVIQVKTESQVKKLSPQYTYLPDEKQYSKILVNLKKLGFDEYEFWLALLWVNWQENKLKFIGCACPASRIEHQDFRQTKKPSVYFWKIEEKSPLKFSSENALV